MGIERLVYISRASPFATRKSPARIFAAFRPRSPRHTSGYPARSASNAAQGLALLINPRHTVNNARIFYKSLCITFSFSPAVLFCD